MLTPMITMMLMPVLKRVFGADSDAEDSDSLDNNTEGNAEAENALQ